MNSRPLVTVIVPTKNSARTLAACLSSVRGQTYAPIELIVVDNPDTTDDTRQIAAKFAGAVIIKGPERCSQRNEGARMAKGEYVAFIDSDMTLAPDVIAACVKRAEEKGVVGIVIPERSFGVGFWAQCKRLERSFYEGVDWIEAARFFRKDVFAATGGYDEMLVSGEDWDVAQRAAALGRIARCQPYIMHDEGALSLGVTLKKKWYYAQKFAAYSGKNEHAETVAKQTGILDRYALFFSRPKKLFADPLLGIGMLFLKTCEFGVGGIGFLLARSTSRAQPAVPTEPFKRKRPFPAILILNGRARNLGDRAIITCMLAQMRQTFPQCSITVEADEPEEMRKAFPNERIVPALIEVTKIQDAGKPYSLRYFAANAGYIANILWRYLKAWHFAVTVRERSSLPLLNEYRAADLVLWAGGDYVSDVYGVRFLFRMFELHLAKVMGKKVALYAQTIGPFSAKNRKRVARQLRQADLILARDAGTVSLLESIGVRDNVRRVADCVLLLKPNETRHVAEAAVTFGLATPTVGFALIAQTYPTVSDEDYRRYVDGVSALIDRVRARGLRAVFIAATPEDLACTKKVNDQMQMKAEIVDLLAYDSGEALALVSRLHATVSSRMHPVIMSVTAGVPAFGINKLGKMRDFLEMAGLGEYHLMMAPFDLAEAQVRFDRFLDQREQSSVVLKEHLPGLQAQSALSATHVQALLGCDREADKVLLLNATGPLISIVMPAHNAADTLPTALASLSALQFDIKRFEVIIVNDGSTDATQRIIEDFAASAAMPVSCRKRDRSAGFGPGIARNAGLDIARGRIIAFTDADCVVDPQWLSVIEKEIVENGRAIIGGEVWCNETVLFPWKISPAGQKVITANMAIDRASLGFHRFGGGFHGFVGEDSDFVMTAERKGFAYEYVPAMRVYHPVRRMSLIAVVRRSVWRKNDVALRKYYGRTAEGGAHPIFRPSIGGVLSPATVLFWLLVTALLYVLTHPSFYPLALVTVILFCISFLLWGYRLCVMYVPEGGRISVTFGERLKTLVCTLIYLPCYVCARLIGSWENGILFL